MKKILFATDFSESCDNAFDYTKKLLNGTECTIDLVNVFDIAVTTLLTINHGAVKGLIFEKRNSVVNRLVEMRSELPESQRGKMFPIYGIYPSSELKQLTDNTKYDLLIMAMRGKYSLLDRLMGSVTAQTIHKCSVPVLVVPNGAKYENVHHILFPTQTWLKDDISTEEENAILSIYNLFSNQSNPKIQMINVGTKTDKIDVVHKRKIYETIDFIQTNAESTEEGILNAFDLYKPQLLAFYKPERKLWERVYHSSITRQLLYRSRLPLLIFPKLKDVS